MQKPLRGFLTTTKFNNRNGEKKNQPTNKENFHKRAA